MTDVLLAILILLVLGAIVLLAALLKRQARGDPEAEQALRAQAAGLEAQTAELRGQIAARAKEAEDLQGQIDAQRSARVAAETRLDAERKSFEEQRALLDEAEAKLKDAFAALSAAALKDGREQFLGAAEQRLKPIQETLKAYEERLREIEKIRTDAYGGLKSHLDTLARAHDLLQKEAHQLSTALRSPTVRGHWGEVTLRRVVEVAGMSSYCDFDEQASVTTDDGRLRPDMIVHLPNHRTIVVDSKAPLAAYIDAVEAPDEAARQASMVRHAKAVRARMAELSQKSYWSQFKEAPDFVVLFLPGESFFSAALEQDRDLIEDGMKSAVVLATPTTLIALLRAVAYGWRQEEVAENAKKIAEAGKDLFDRLRVFADHLAGVGKGLRQAVGAYDDAVGSYEKRLEPAARKLADLGASSGKDVPAVPVVDGPTRLLPESAAPGQGVAPAEGESLPR